MTREPAGAALLRPELTEAVVDAVFVELAAVGYGRLSMQKVAARAGVGKSALYRRWPGKREMVTDVLSRLGVPDAPPADTGSLVEDLRLLAREIRDWLTLPRLRGITPDLIAELGRDPDLAVAFRDRLAGPRRDRVRPVLAAAVARGEIPDDPLAAEIATDVLASAPFWRLTVAGEAVDDRYLDRLVEMVASGLVSTNGRDSDR